MNEIELEKRIKELESMVDAYRFAAMEDIGLDNTDKMAKLFLKVSRLELAIRKHREQTGHNMCWENDEELWATLEDGIKIDHTPPNWCEFMNRCVEYRASKDKK